MFSEDGGVSYIMTALAHWPVKNDGASSEFDTYAEAKTPTEMGVTIGAIETN